MQDVAEPYSSYPAARAVTTGPRYHWFGYYDKSPWSGHQQYMLAMESRFMDRSPTADDSIKVGLVEPAAGTEFHALAETRAWNWQQGTMLQWLGTDPDRLIIFNSAEDGRYVSVILDVHTAERRTLPSPVYAVSRDGRQAVAPNFSRIARTRPGYGYATLPDPWEGQDHPAEDGIWWLDLETGVNRFIISLQQIVDIRHDETMAGAEHWFNHLQFAPDGSRFLFLHRWFCTTGKRRHYTRMFTARPDGSDLYCVADHDMISHFDWCGSKHILAWATHRQIGDRYFLYRDQSPHFSVVGGDVFTCDGHCSYSPDGRWILTDTYPDAEEKRTLLLYDTQGGTRADIGRFRSPKQYSGEIRCDLHPRWSRDGRQVCIDSLHEGHRQLYVVDVAEIVQ